MIDVALTYIKDILNENFKNEFSISENKVVLSNIIKADGSLTQNVDGKIVFFLVNLEEESVLKNSINRSINHENSFLQKPPALYLNLHLLFCSNFDSNVYVEGLQYLSALIRFFQINKKIEINSAGNSNQKINRLSFELTKLDYDQISHLWSAIGSKLMPSVLYKVGMVVLDDTSVTKIVPSISKPQNQS